MRLRNTDKSMYFPPGKDFQKTSPYFVQKGLILQCYILVGVTGFEPAASWSRTKRTTKLCHTPRKLLLYRFVPLCDWQKGELFCEGRLLNV